MVPKEVQNPVLVVQGQPACGVAASPPPEIAPGPATMPDKSAEGSPDSAHGELAEGSPAPAQGQPACGAMDRVVQPLAGLGCGAAPPPSETAPWPGAMPDESAEGSPESAGNKGHSSVRAPSRRLSLRSTPRKVQFWTQYRVCFNMTLSGTRGASPAAKLTITCYQQEDGASPQQQAGTGAGLVLGPKRAAKEILAGAPVAAINAAVNSQEPEVKPMLFCLGCTHRLHGSMVQDSKAHYRR